MILYILLIILFLAVFAWLAWRIVMKQVPAETPPPETSYICPVCNDEHCSCHKKTDGDP